MIEELETLIIGAGQAGMPLARSLANAGWRVGLAERTYLGGSCVNFGCTPSKAVIASAKLAYQARRAGDYGLSIPEIGVDFARVIERAMRLVQESRHSLETTFSDNPKLYKGHAHLTAHEGERFRIVIDDKEVVTKHVILNTGTTSQIPKIDGLDTVDFLTAENWLEQKELPEKLLILGAGYIGLELGQFYTRMGCQVTIIDSNSTIASKEDSDVATTLQSLLQKEGMTFQLHLNTTQRYNSLKEVIFSLRLDAKLRLMN
jgi:pyruvate/2-oxoglutarate dehydrogenase complex dihydrolipoamide dehydrogenase (E3) component